MKQLLFVILAVAMAFRVSAQASKVDTVAVMILDQMSNVIGELTSCSFTLKTQTDAVDQDAGLISHFAVSEVYFDGPDKMLVQAKGDNGHRGLWYNGKLLVYYSFNENNYAVIDAPPTSLQTIDSIHNNFGIDFPAADFFYPTFTDDLLHMSNQVIYNGLKTVEGKECFHIVARGKEVSVQLWIANDALYLPVKMIIISSTTGQTLEYEATFTNWQMNPTLPEAIFNFLPPPGAHQVSILPKNSN